MISIRPRRPAAAPPIFAVERCPQGGWAAFTVDLAGGIGPQASTAFAWAHEAEAWASVRGILADPYVEAA